MGPAVPMLAAPAGAPAGRADSVVAFALRQLGAPYCYAGTRPATGFDCSGFVQYVYGRFGVPVPHATALLIGAGRAVPRADARPGGLVVFAGTAPGSAAAGHAGIVVSAVGAVPVRVVHASSARREAGVKVSASEGTGYETRFLQVRRVLD
ncbi:MAG: C40 family peptidase [Janthinobacterium lividum]